LVNEIQERRFSFAISVRFQNGGNFSSFVRNTGAIDIIEQVKENLMLQLWEGFSRHFSNEVADCSPEKSRSTFVHEHVAVLRAIRNCDGHWGIHEKVTDAIALVDSFRSQFRLTFRSFTSNFG
jgi:hypothetical protein